MGSRLQSLKMVSIVNDCGDKYSKVEYTRDGLQWDFERA